MKLKHRVQINVADKRGEKQRVLGSTKLCIPQRIIRLLFGDFCEVLVLNPGNSVQKIEIHEIKGGAENA